MQTLSILRGTNLVYSYNHTKDKDIRVNKS